MAYLLCTLLEAAEIRAQRGPSSYLVDRNAIRNLRQGKIGGGSRTMSISVQIQVKQAAMVDYNPKTH
jgi:hypothetical protein